MKMMMLVAWFFGSSSDYCREEFPIRIFDDSRRKFPRTKLLILIIMKRISIALAFIFRLGYVHLKGSFSLERRVDVYLGKNNLFFKQPSLVGIPT
jgi:hypothetical protein